MTTRQFSLTSDVYRSDRILVHRGVFHGTGETCIFKRLNSEYPDSRQVARISSEYRTLRRLDDPNIIRAYGLQRYGNSVGILFEDIHGIRLGSYLKSNPINRADELGRFYFIAIKLARAFISIHRHGIIHKNIHPDNIIINPDSGVLKLIDFNEAADTSPENYEEPKFYAPGRLPYISPEQTGRISRRPDYRTDFYSLGVIFHEMLAGSLPYDAQDHGEWIYCHIARQAPSLVEKNTFIPPPLAAIVSKLLNKNPEYRFQSASGLVHDLERCLEAWQTDVPISVSSIGRHDVPDRFQVSRKVIGRETQMAILLDAVKEASEGKTRLVLVSGQSGVGKTALITELHTSVYEKYGSFIKGTCEPFSRAIPYQAFSQAIGELIRLLLTQSDEQLSRVKHRLMAVLGPNGRLICDLVPEMEWLLGEQPPVQKLSPLESKNRFNMMIENCMAVFPGLNAPLVIVLDDLQWAESASLELIERLACSDIIHHLLIIGAYRSNEVNEHHPLGKILSGLRQKIPIEEIELNPLTETDTNRLVSNTLYRKPEECLPLSSILYRRTRGNPFFVGDLLMTFHEQKHIYRLHEQGIWEWDIEKIENAAISTNVAEFTLGQLKQLPDRTREALKLAACIGTRFSLNLLSLIRETPFEEISLDMAPAIERGLISPPQRDFTMARPRDMRNDLDTSCRFLHDLIQKAAYQLNDSNDIPRIHLSIGRMMENHFSERESHEHLMVMVNQFNAGIDLIHDETEIRSLILLNYKAGKTARESAAYYVARDYLEKAIILLGNTPWSMDYQLAFDVFTEYAQCTFLCGERNASRNVLADMHRHCRTKADRTRLHMIETVQYTMDSRYAKAIDSGVKALALSGVSLKPDPGFFSLLRAYFSVKTTLRRRSAAALIDLPLSESPELETIGNTMTELLSSAKLGGYLMFTCMLPVTCLGIILRRGSFPEASTCYASYGCLLTGMGHFKEGFEFGKLALAFNARHQMLRCTTRTNHLFAHYIAYWNMEPANVVDYYQKAIQAGYQSGDTFFVCWALVHADFINPALNAPALMEKLTANIATARKYRVQTAESSLMIRVNYIANLCGLTRSRNTMSTGAVCEEALLSNLKEKHYRSGIAIFFLLKMKLCYLYEDYHGAWACLGQLQNHKNTLRGYYAYHHYHVYSFLVTAALLPELPVLSRIKAMRWMKQSRRLIRKWAAHCPEGFGHHGWLIEAEYQRLRHQWEDAGNAYARAIEDARQKGFLKQEALCNDVAARCFIRLGQPDRAARFLREARFLYEQWGADEKVKQINEDHGWVITSGTAPP